MTQRDLFYEEPDLASYDVILVNSSGGKDSAASLAHTVKKADEAGVRDRLAVVHADLGRVEWEGTPELVEEHAAHYGLRFIKVRRNGKDLLDHVEERGMWPDAKNRYCTSQHKTGPILRVLTALVGEVNARRLVPFAKPLKRLGLRQVRVLNVMGMRAEESPRRAKKPAFSHNHHASNGKRRVDDWLPVHDWTLAEVWRVHRESGLRPHPAYAMGMSRASCSFCVLASKKDLVTAARLRPRLAAEYLRVEEAAGHDFRLKLPMREIIRIARTVEAPENDPREDPTHER